MRLVLIFSLLLFSTYSFAGSEKKLLKKARMELASGNYPEAKKLYKQLLVLKPDNAEYQFETGLTYYTSHVEVEKSINFFNAALKKSDKDTIAEIFFYLGRAHQYVGDFEKAIQYYNRFKGYVQDNAEGIILNRNVTRYIEMCNNGIAMTGKPNKDVTITNLKGNVNTAGAEYAPVVKEDNSLIIFTGRRNESTGGKIYNDNKEYEDIYISRKEQDEWMKATKLDSSNVYINKNINTKWHDAAIAYNQNEDKLFVYRKNQIWVSDLVDGKWTDPVKLNKNVNSSFHNPSVYISPDENTLLVVSTDREGGYGGRDIWISNKESSGEWGALTNLGEAINTEFDEDAPYMTSDGKTLYFSSKGHTSMGGYDVFRSEKMDDGTWSAPINLGAPINSPGDDIYYVPNSDGTTAYYSSSRTGGYGDMDIYMIQLECRSIPSTEINGIVLAGERQLPIGGEMVVEDSDGNEVTRVRVDPKTGTYLVVLQPEETYDMQFVADQPWFVERAHKMEVTIPKQCDPYPLYQEICLKRLKNEDGDEYAQEARFKDAFFDYQDTVAKHYNIDLAQIDDDSTGSASPNDSLDEGPYNIGGTLSFNEALKVEEGAKVYLLNDKNEIVRVAETDENGNFVFKGLTNLDEYDIALDEDDLKYQYYGTSPANTENGVIVSGDFGLIDENGIVKPMDSVNVYFFDGDKNVSNLSSTNDSGQFSIDNVPQDLAEVNAINEKAPFVYNISPDDLTYAVSAFIKTIDPNNNEINYSEYVDIIELPEITTNDHLDDVAFNNIYFDFDKYFLRQTSINILDKIVAYMSAHEDVTIYMDGHTDWFGTEVYNDKLSKNRAQSARDYLIKKGINADRIGMAWHGETVPAVPNANPDGTDSSENRQLNRRVEFKITTDEMAFTLSI